MYRNLIPCLIACLICIVSCQREFGDLLPVVPTPELPDTVAVEPDPPKEVPKDNKVQTSVQGKVTDENGDPLPNVVVTCGDKTDYSNEHGIFRINDILVPEHYTFIHANKTGYFTGSRTIISQPYGMGFVKIKMIPKSLKGTFDAMQPATIAINNTSNITFSAGSIESNDGLEYGGKVKVYAAEINPESADFNEAMPGDLRAITADSQYTALKSYGMLTVTLETESGQPLQIAQGKSAVIKMKVPASLTNSAPAEIPLWHFSETDGIWREEGKALLENGYYVGSVSHFSAWNYDVPSAFVFVSLTVKGIKGGRMPYTRVRVTDTRNGVTSDLYTDSTGFIRTWVPKNVPIEVQVMTQCGDVLYTKSVDPLNADADLGSAYVYPSVKTANITGSVHDCNDQPLAGVNAMLNYRGLNYTTPVIDGRFDFSVSTCENGDNTAYLSITDQANNYITSFNPITVTTQSSDVGIAKICNDEVDSSTHYIAFNLGTDSIERPGRSAIHTYSGFKNGDSLTRINCTHAIMDVGAFNITVNFRDSSVHTSTISNPGNIELYLETYVPVAPMIVNVVEYGSVGQDVYLNFSGSYQKLGTNQIVPLTGELRTTRTE
jgi:hypothetical protein